MLIMCACRRSKGGGGEVLFGAREVGCSREVAALYSNCYKQVSLCGTCLKSDTL